MKSLRMLALMFAVGAFSVMAYAQQEVDPDHFDQPAAYAAKSQANHAPANHHGRKNLKTASKHNIKKSRHHTAQV